MSESEIVLRGRSLMTVDIYSHHFSVRGFGRIEKTVLLEYCRTLAQYGLKRVGRGRNAKFVKAMLKVFVGVTADREEFRFHVNLLDDLFRHLASSGVNRSQIFVNKIPMYTASPVEFTYIDHRTPRKYQYPIIDYILSNGKIKVVTLDPGRGKTFIALAAIRDLEVRTFFCIKASYIEKWIKDAEESFSFQPGELMVVRGSKHLKRLLEIGVAGELEAKIILCSNTTYYQYLKDYEMYQKDMLRYGYACLPYQMWEKLDIGLRVVDETHEQIHFNFRLDLYTHVPKTLALSGTLFSDDKLVTRMMEVMFPPTLRYHDDEKNIYIAAEALLYTMEKPDTKVRYMNQQMQMYAHVKFEQSIIKNKKLLNEYTNMLCDFVFDRYVAKRLKGQKIAIYCSTKEMCTILSDKLKRIHTTLNVERYIGEDDYETMLEADIIVTTLKSLGTAIDIPGLRVVLLTDSLGSLQLNIQVMGRLRPLKDWPGTTPEFLFLVCQDIGKQMDYYVKKKEILKGRVISFHTNYTGYKL